MDMKVYVDEHGEIVAVVMEMALTPPPDATTVNSEKVARMMSDPTVAESCVLGCPFAPVCETLANAMAALDISIDDFIAEEDMMTGTDPAEPPQPEAGSAG